MMRIINRPKRYVHRNAFTETYADFEELKLFYEDKDWMVDRIEQLQSDLAMLVSLKPYAAINFIRKESVTMNIFENMQSTGNPR